MRQKHGAIATSHGIQFYNAETFDEVRHELIDEALLKLESHAALVSALEGARADLVITKINTEIECVKYENKRWEGVAERLQQRIDMIDTVLALAKGE